MEQTLQTQKPQALATPIQIHPHVPTTYIPTDSDWRFMVQWGESAIRSGMLPSGIKSKEAAALIILKGRELGLSFMTSIANIHVINGKPTMSAELIQGLARRNLPGLTINILESTKDVAKIEFIRPEKGSKPFVQTFTLDEANSAKLTSKDVWKSYPAAMLWSRAVTAGLRKVCPEALMGISYTPEEMGANVNESGDVIETTGKHVPEPIAPKPLKWQMTPEEAEDLKTHCKELGWGQKALASILEKEFKKNEMHELTSDEYFALMVNLEQKVQIKRASEMGNLEASINPPEEPALPWDKHLDPRMVK
jgi:hypothetical protein